MNARPAILPDPTGVLAPVARVSPGRPHVTIRGLSKRFDKAVIYDKFDLDIPRGELISVFGPNGCGKSTLINMIAGLTPPDEGQILFDGMLLSEIKFGYVFQNYREALFPWLRAFDNIAYPLKMMKVPPKERRLRTEKLVAHLGIKLDLNLFPLVSHDLEEAVYLADRVLLLSRHPARVADFPRVSVSRPRTDATLSDPEFVRIKAHCLDVFQREVRRA